MILQEKYYTMSDGVRLFTVIALPDGEKKYPVVFMRTPYAKKGVPASVETFENDPFIKNGYALVYQHTRGRGNSEGICKPYVERDDGLDSLEIIRKESFYNGEIYLTGGSYPATVHLCYIGTNPPDVKAAALSIQTDRMYYRNYRNGCCYRFCNIDWWLSMLSFRYPDQSGVASAIKRPYYKIMERAFGEDVPEYTEQLLNDTCNEFWQNQENFNASDNLTIPTLFTEGWFDFYIDGMFSMWDRLPEETKKRSALVVGPWGHGVKLNGMEEYAFTHGNLETDCVISFFNSIRDNTPFRDLELGKVTYHSVGKDSWLTDDAATEEMKLYFNNDGTLLDKPRVMGEQSYVYDPDKPLNVYKYHNIYKAEKEGTREEIRSFVSAPFEEETDFYGKIQWSMNVKSDCDDTAFFIRVHLVEDGVSYNLTETVTSLSHIDKDYVADKVCRINIATPPIGFTVKKGCAIRVDVTSHSDLYVPHSNTVGHWATVEETKIATNTVICDEDSFLVFPKRIDKI